MAASSGVCAVLKSLLPAIDDDTLAYFESMLLESGYEDRDALKENLAPFIESYGLSSDLESAETICNELCNQLKSLGIKEHVIGHDDPKLLDKAVILNDIANKHLTESEKETVEGLWYFTLLYVHFASMQIFSLSTTAEGVSLLCEASAMMSWR